MSARSITLLARAVLGMLLGLVLSANAAIDAYQFDDAAQEERFRQLINELRCPKCQNQNIADSDAPLSKDLRQRVYELMEEGRDDAEIVDFLVERYGTFVTYRPPVNAVTGMLWFGPVLLVMGAAFCVGFWIRRRSRDARVELTEDEQRRIADLLRQSDGKGL